MPNAEITIGHMARHSKQSQPPADDPKRPRRTGVPLHVYIPPDLRAAMDRLAGENRRSLTSEVMIALENHLKAVGQWPPPAAAK
jgi:hypothetical protein